MTESKFRSDVLNPCPKCGKRFDFNGCMTFMDLFLQEDHGGLCPACGSQVVITVEDGRQPEEWVRAQTLSEIRTVLIKDLYLSVRAICSLEHLAIANVGQLLDRSQATIPEKLGLADSVVGELRRLLASKGLSLPA
jgi:predicted RNA-binding Zn-ribbon protein involved in translation (DUF1610 family)